MNIRWFFWHNLFSMAAGKNVGASAPLVPQPARAGRSRPHRTLGFLLLVLGLHLVARVQAQTVVSFTLDFPDSEPSHYEIAVSSDGHSTYDSDGKLSPDSEGDPFHLDFSVSSETSRRIFDLAERAHYFQEDIDSRKKNLASTGVKTLTYKDSGRSSRATYNYSPVAAVQQLTQLFQGLSTTLEFGRRLEYFHHYQKLALDEELKRMEDMANRNDLPGVGRSGADSAADCE